MISMDTLFTFQQVSADPYDWIFFLLSKGNLLNNIPSISTSYSELLLLLLFSSKMLHF